LVRSVFPVEKTDNVWFGIFRFWQACKKSYLKFTAKSGLKFVKLVAMNRSGKKSRFLETAIKSGAGVVTQVSIFETIQRYGKGTSYLGSDDITRFRFLAAPISISPMLVTVTRTRLNATFVDATRIPSYTIPAAFYGRL
jgi:hypothetical protein